MGLVITYVIRANHMISFITSSTTDPRSESEYTVFQLFNSKWLKWINNKGPLKVLPITKPINFKYVCIAVYRIFFDVTRDVGDTLTK